MTWNRTVLLEQGSLGAVLTRTCQSPGWCCTYWEGVGHREECELGRTISGTWGKIYSLFGSPIWLDRLWKCPLRNAVLGFHWSVNPLGRSNWIPVWTVYVKVSESASSLLVQEPEGWGTRKNREGKRERGEVKCRPRIEDRIVQLQRLAHFWSEIKFGNCLWLENG